MIELEDVIILPYNEILNVDRDDFTFKNTTAFRHSPMWGRIDRVLFAECVKELPLQIERMRGQPIFAVRDNCVGWRDAFTEPMYFEFPGRTKNVIVVFTKPERRWFVGKRGLFFRLLRARFNTERNYRDFYNFQKQINKLGWTTYDRG